jgi:hypothetical protein
LQSNISISNGGGHPITGTLKAVTGYTGFSDVVAKQSGNYLALHCAVAGEANVEYSAEVVGGTSDVVFVEGTGILVARITASSQSLKVTAVKPGYDAYTKTYTVSGLTLES